MCIFATKKNMEEIWKDIEGYEGLYQVSNMGRVRSLRKNIILREGISRGYSVLNLSKNGKPLTKKVHRLVANAFIPNPDNLPQVNHKDENKLNNCADNLEWCTQEYNLNYGTGNKKRGLSNTNGKLSKPVCQYSKDGCFIKEWKSIMDVERMTGYDCGHISACCRNIRKTAYKYIWKYKKEEG